jgi:hypothetical protein
MQARNSFFFFLPDSILFSDFFFSVLFLLLSWHFLGFVASHPGHAWTDMMMSHSAVRAMARHNGRRI